MTAKLPSRFWIELSAGLLSALSVIVTLIWPQWIEAVFGVDPDGGSGEFEWMFVALSVLAILLLLVARRDWKRALLSQ